MKVLTKYLGLGAMRTYKFAKQDKKNSYSRWKAELDKSKFIAFVL